MYISYNYLLFIALFLLQYAELVQGGHKRWKSRDSDEDISEKISHHSGHYRGHNSIVSHLGRFNSARGTRLKYTRDKVKVDNRYGRKYSGKKPTGRKLPDEDKSSTIPAITSSEDLSSTTASSGEDLSSTTASSSEDMSSTTTASGGSSSEDLSSTTALSSEDMSSTTESSGGSSIEQDLSSEKGGFFSNWRLPINPDRLCPADDSPKSPEEKNTDKESKDESEEKKTDTDSKNGSEEKKTDTGSKDESEEATKDNLVKRINCYRKCHKVEPLTRSTEVEVHSNSWAEHLGSKVNGLEHSKGSGYGENLYAGGNPSSAIDSWYFECFGKYTYNSEDNPHGCGHFTQLVWTKSRKVGIGIAPMERYGNIIVANFDPPGNYRGEYSPNVPKPDDKCVEKCKSGSAEGRGWKRHGKYGHRGKYERQGNDKGPNPEQSKGGFLAGLVNTLTGFICKKNIE